MLHKMELLNIETRPIPFTPILCFFKKFQVVKIHEVLLMFVRSWPKNMYKLLLIHYKLGSQICEYSMLLKFSVLFFIPWSCHFYIGMHNYDYKFCSITFVQKDLGL